MPSNQARSSTKRARRKPPAVNQVHTARATRGDDDDGDEPRDLIDGALKQTIEQRERIGTLVDRLGGNLNILLGTPAPDDLEVGTPAASPEGSVMQLRRELDVLASAVDALDVQVRRMDAL